MWLKNLQQRLLAGFLLFGVILLVVWRLGWVLGVGISLFALVSELEMLGALRSASFRPSVVPGVLLAVTMYPMYHWKGLEGLVALFTMLCAVVIAISVLQPKRRFLDTAVSVFAMVYPCWFFLFLLLLGELETPALARTALIVALMGPVATDVGAYFSGHFFGRHKLAPEISPKKTIEGAVGALIITAGAMAAIGWFIHRSYYPALPVWHYPIMGLIVSVLAQSGDLMASGIKRFAGIKDFSNALPGHGGFMDRMDSILFGGAAVYCYLQLFFLQ